MYTGIPIQQCCDSVILEFDLANLNHIIVADVLILCQCTIHKMYSGYERTMGSFSLEVSVLALCSWFLHGRM